MDTSKLKFRLGFLEFRLSTQMKKALSHRFNETSMCQSLFPCCGYPFLSVESASNLTKDSTSSVCIIAEVHSKQAPFSERIRLVESPQSCFERLNHIPTSLDFRWFEHLERIPRYFVNFWSQRLLKPIPRDGTVSL